MDIYLIRHAECQGNVDRIVIGRGGSPLTTEGKAQARRIAKFLKETPIDAIYSSPSKRAMQTAQILMKDRDSIPFVQEENLDEIDFGDWVGRKISDVLANEVIKNYFYDPESIKLPGEQIRDVEKRAAGVIEKIVSEKKYRRVAVVSHADVIKPILVHYLGFPFTSWQGVRIDNASLSILRFDDGKKPRALVTNLVTDSARYMGPERPY